MQPVHNSFWRRLVFVLALLLIPAVCVLTAFAINLQITSPYFTMSFGGSQQVVGTTFTNPPIVVDTGGPNIVNPPDTQPPTQNPPSPPDTPPVDNGNGCLLGLLCLNVNTAVGAVPAINLSLGKSDQVAASGVSLLGGQDGCLLGVVCISTGGLGLLGTPAASQGAAASSLSAPEGECGAVACVDAGLDAGTQGVAVGAGVEVPLVDTGAALGVQVGQEETNVNVDLNLLGTGNGNQGGDGVNLNLLNTVEVGLGGSGGVNLNLKLPGLFP